REEGGRKEERGEEAGCEKGCTEKSRESGSEKVCAEKGRGEKGERKRIRIPGAVLGTLGSSRQSTRGRAHSRFYPCAIVPDLHAAARLYGRGLHQGGTSGRRRHHAHAAPRREGAGQPLFHDAERQ